MCKLLRSCRAAARLDRDHSFCTRVVVGLEAESSAFSSLTTHGSEASDTGACITIDELIRPFFSPFALSHRSTHECDGLPPRRRGCANGPHSPRLCPRPLKRVHRQGCREGQRASRLRRQCRGLEPRLSRSPTRAHDSSSRNGSSVRNIDRHQTTAETTAADACGSKQKCGAGRPLTMIVPSLCAIAKTVH